MRGFGVGWGGRVWGGGWGGRVWGGVGGFGVGWGGRVWGGVGGREDLGWEDLGQGIPMNLWLAKLAASCKCG